MSKVYKNTHYGPVPQQSGAGGTQVDSQTQGSLLGMVMQPGDCSFSGDWWNGRYLEVWKGPWATLKDYPATVFKVGQLRDTAVAASALDKAARFSPPDAGKDQWGNQQSWVIDSCQVQQLAAGDHGLMKVQYIASAGYTWSGLAQDDSSQETWQLDWQPYTLRPYAFCKNDQVQDPLAEGYQEDMSQTAWRKNIEDFFRSPKGNKSEFEYQNATGSQLLKLNYAEQHVAKKVMMDRSCVWHYPLVTHVTVSRKPKPADVLVFNEKYPHDDLGQDLDAAVDNLPSSCPYSFKDTSWKWLKIADTVTEARSKTETTFTRREVYQGMKDPDVNYYGTSPFSHTDLASTRWEVAKL